MTTNHARAAQIINAALIESGYPEDIAQALADAGLLAPDVDLAADYHRVRRELEERIRVWQKVADKLEASGDTDVAEVMRHVGRSAASILNGGDDE